MQQKVRHGNTMDNCMVPVSYSFEVFFSLHNVNANETFCFPCADPLQAKKVRKVPPGLPSSVSTFFFNLMLNKLMSSIQYLLATKMDSIDASGHTLHSNCSLLNKIID